MQLVPVLAACASRALSFGAARGATCCVAIRLARMFWSFSFAGSPRCWRNWRQTSPGARVAVARSGRLTGADSRTQFAALFAAWRSLPKQARTHTRKRFFALSRENTRPNTTTAAATRLETCARMRTSVNNSSEPTSCGRFPLASINICVHIFHIFLLTHIL